MVRLKVLGPKQTASGAQGSCAETLSRVTATLEVALSEEWHVADQVTVVDVSRIWASILTACEGREAGHWAARHWNLGMHGDGGLTAFIQRRHKILKEKDNTKNVRLTSYFLFVNNLTAVETTLLGKVLQRRLQWLGHVERMTIDRIPNNA